MIALRLEQTIPADPATGRVLAKHYAIVETVSGATVNPLRLSNTDDIRLYAGTIGYRVNEQYWGKHYAARVCLALKTRAVEHGLRELWLTCNPDNWPSRRACEHIGAQLIEIIDLPEDLDMYLDGERQKCRYRWQLN